MKPLLASELDDILQNNNFKYIDEINEFDDILLSGSCYLSILNNISIKLYNNIIEPDIYIDVMRDNRRGRLYSINTNINLGKLQHSKIYIYDDETDELILRVLISNFKYRFDNYNEHIILRTNDKDYIYPDFNMRRLKKYNNKLVYYDVVSVINYKSQNYEKFKFGKVLN